MNNWEVKDLLLEDDRQQTIYQDNEYSSGMYAQQPLQQRNSNYGGFNNY